MSRMLSSRFPVVTVFRSKCEMAVALQLPVGAADQDVRHVVVLMLIRVAHVRAVAGSASDRAACRRRPESTFSFSAKYAERRDVIAVEVRVALDLRRIVLMVRSAVEARR